MARLPVSNKASEAEYAEFTNQTWTELDGWYGWWGDRWKRTMDYIRSQHWRVLQEVDSRQIPAWKRFPVANFTMAIYGDYLKSWLQSRVRFSAIPESPSQEDLTAADIGDYALRYAWDILDMENKRIDIGAWLICTGNASVRVFWDTDTGNLVPLAQPGPDGTIIPLDPQTLEPDPMRLQPELVDAGEVGLEVLSPQAVRRPASKQHGAMVGFTLSYDDAVGRYGEEVAEKLSYNAGVSSNIELDLMNPISPMRADMKQERALIIEHYIPRSRRHPQGLWWTANERQLVTPPSALPAGRVPVVSFRWIPVPGHPYFGTTPLYDLTYTNKVYDDMLARTLEWSSQVVPKALFPAGGGLRPGDFTDEPGQQIQYNQGAEPTYTSVPEPPDLFERVRNEAREDMLIVGGYRFGRQEDLPHGESVARTRKAPSTLNQGMEVGLAHLNSKAAWEELGYVLLAYMGQYYDDQRTAMISGPDRQYQWRELKASALQNLRARLRVDETPLYPWNRQSLQDAVIGVLNTQAGSLMFTDAQGNLDRDRIEAAFQATGLDSIVATTDPDVLEARNENYAFRNMQEGTEPPKVMPWQEDASHIAEHKREVKSLQFQTWPPEAQQAFLQHISEHEQRIAEQAQEQQSQMIAQERALREVRAESESAQHVREQLGEQLARLMTDVIRETVKAQLAQSTEEKS